MAKQACAALEFEVPRANQGQIVEYAYGVTPRGAEVERRWDRGDDSVTFYWARSGRRLSAGALARYGLAERGC